MSIIAFSVSACCQRPTSPPCSPPPPLPPSPPPSSSPAQRVDLSSGEAAWGEASVAALRSPPALQNYATELLFYESPLFYYSTRRLYRTSRSTKLYNTAAHSYVGRTGNATQTNTTIGRSVAQRLQEEVLHYTPASSRGRQQHSLARSLQQQQHNSLGGEQQSSSSSSSRMSRTSCASLPPAPPANALAHSCAIFLFYVSGEI